jgi:hypothetical protein
MGPQCNKMSGRNTVVCVNCTTASPRSSRNSQRGANGNKRIMVMLEREKNLSFVHNLR